MATTTKTKVYYGTFTVALVAALAVLGVKLSEVPPAPAPTATVSPPAPSASAVPPVPSPGPAPTSSPPPPAPSPASPCVAGSGRDYEVGIGQAFASIGAVPLETLRAGDTVRIHHRAAPYKEKLMIGGVGTAAAPIRVCGVKSPTGQRPVIDGQDATTRASLVFPYDGHQPRGLIIVGWKRTDDWKVTPEHIVIDGLELRGAAPPNRFTSKAGVVTAYADHAAGIFVQRGKHIVIRDCVIHDNGNGLFVGSAGGDELTEDVLIESNDIHTNGNLGSDRHHNVYNEVSGIVYQFNRFGPPKGAKTEQLFGSNIKDRSAGVVIRYNVLEDGAHIIDLVDAQEALGNLSLPSYRSTFVYGNVIVRGPRASGSMVHYGGDTDMPERNRKGTLFFFHNTVVIDNAGYKPWEKTAIFELTTNDERLESRNNVYVSGPVLANIPVMLMGARDQRISGVASFGGDWIRTGITFTQPGTSDALLATETGFATARRGASAGLDASHHPTAASPFLGRGVPLAYPNHTATLLPLGGVRRAESPPTPGAFVIAL